MATLMLHFSMDCKQYYNYVITLIIKFRIFVIAMKNVIINIITMICDSTWNSLFCEMTKINIFLLIKFS